MRTETLRTIPQRRRRLRTPLLSRQAAVAAHTMAKLQTPIAFRASRNSSSSSSNTVSTGGTFLAAALRLRLRHPPMILTATCKCQKFLSGFYIPCVPPSATILYILSQMFAFIFQKGLSSWLPMQTIARMHTTITSTAM